MSGADITLQHVDEAIALLCAFRDKDKTGSMATVVQARILKAGLVVVGTPAPKREPGALARPLPDDLHSLTLVQTTIHDNWRQDTKPRGRPGKNGKRSRQTPTRYGVTVQAWDRPEADINMASGDWQYHLNSDLFTAEEFRTKALDLMNYVQQPDGSYVIDKQRRNAVENPISEDCAAAMIQMANDFSDPSYRFACLKKKGKGNGTWIAELQFVRLKITPGLLTPVIEDAVLITKSDKLHLAPFDNSSASGGAFDPRSNAVLQSRFTQRDTPEFRNWKTT